MLGWLDYLRELHLISMIIRILLSLLLGGILGFERGRKHRPAGFRTYMLVCLGAALVMMTNQYIITYFGGSDPARMGAQVVSGIGFLGAGSIIVTGRNQVKGITTAAGLWTAACSGLAIGIGFYEGALLAGFGVYAVMASLHKLDDYIRDHAAVIEIYLEYESRLPFSDFLNHARSNNFEVTDIQISKNKLAKSGGLSAVMMVKTLEPRTHSETMEILSVAPGVHYIEKL